MRYLFSTVVQIGLFSNLFIEDLKKIVDVFLLMRLANN